MQGSQIGCHFHFGRMAVLMAVPYFGYHGSVTNYRRRFCIL
jgi:hypothetical protein